jgi:hypothetical protein
VNALTKPLKFDAAETAVSRGESALPPSLVTTQPLFTADYIRPLGPLRREPMPEERATRPFRSFGALVLRSLWPRHRPQYLSEHLCRDIGIEYTPEPPVRTWPW